MVILLVLNAIRVTLNGNLVQFLLNVYILLIDLLLFLY